MADSTMKNTMDPNMPDMPKESMKPAMGQGKCQDVSGHCHTKGSGKGMPKQGK